MLIRKKQQPGKTTTPVTPNTPTFKTREVSKSHLFSDDLFLQRETIFLRTKLDINNESLKPCYNKYQKMLRRFTK